MKHSPAAYVISKFGGVMATAKAMRRTRAAIYLWLKPKSKGGTGGQVPGPLIIKVLTIARARGIEITVTDIVYGHE